jgi:murein endopeptidase
VTVNDDVCSGAPKDTLAAARTTFPMSWRLGEVWLDTNVLWFREQAPPRLGAPARAAAGGAVALPELPRFGPAETGLDASRRRRLAARVARRRRRATRAVPAVAFVVGSATMLPIGGLRHRGGNELAGPFPEDPPTLISLEQFGSDFRLLETEPAESTDTHGAKPVRVAWHHASSIGLQYAGRLVNATQLPVEGPGWVTWNPVTDSSPNVPGRLYGHERTIRSILSVVAGYREAHPHAQRVVVGDISFHDGGRMDQHVSHQNGLDVDVYYPRLDRHTSAPIRTRQIDRQLAQDLLERFVAAGATKVFVGYSTGLRGPSGVVVPYPNHENHMHIRFPVPG